MCSGPPAPGRRRYAPGQPHSTGGSSRSGSQGGKPGALDGSGAPRSQRRGIQRFGTRIQQAIEEAVSWAFPAGSSSKGGSSCGRPPCNNRPCGTEAHFPRRRANSNSSRPKKFDGRFSSWCKNPMASFREKCRMPYVDSLAFPGDRRYERGSGTTSGRAGS